MFEGKNASWEPLPDNFHFNIKSTREDDWSAKVCRMDLEEKGLAPCGQLVFADRGDNC